MMASGEQEAGVSIYFVNEAIDAGELCGQEVFSIRLTIARRIHPALQTHRRRSAVAHDRGDGARQYRAPPDGPRAGVVLPLA